MCIIDSDLPVEVGGPDTTTPARDPDEMSIHSSEVSSILLHADSEGPSRSVTPRPGDSLTTTPVKRKDGPQLPKKRYQKAGLFSNTYKEDE